VPTRACNGQDLVRRDQCHPAGVASVQLLLVLVDPPSDFEGGVLVHADVAGLAGDRLLAYVTGQDEGTSAAGESTVFTVRVIECAELIAADLFRNAEQNRRRIVFGSYDQMLRV